MQKFDFQPTPIQKEEKLSKLLGINLFIKRDDLFPISGGGNKGRKLQYILKKVINEKYTAVVTAGGIQSNHTRSTAIMCNNLGLKCTVIIHANKPMHPTTGNLKILELLGTKIIYCSMENVASTMDAAVDDFSAEGEKPFYLWGGGHCLEGTFAYYDAVKELTKQTAIKFDKVYHASGTGATQAGLHVGFCELSPVTKVIGVSIARDNAKGTVAVTKSAEELLAYLGPNELLEPINFDDNFLCGGYEKSTTELLEMISYVAKKSGIILDPTYSGKAFLAMLNHVKTKQITLNQNILFWHTGGLLNLMAS